MSSAVAVKDTEAFRTISEVGEALNLPQHVLRFWETRFTQIKPLKRAGGRRFYRPQDVELLGAIRHLLYDQGYTIKGVQRILKEQGPRGVAALARRPAGASDLVADDPSPPAVEILAPAPPPLDDAPTALLRLALAELASCRAILEAAAAE